MIKIAKTQKDFNECFNWVNPYFSVVASLTCRSFATASPGWGKFSPRHLVSLVGQWLKRQAMKKRHKDIDFCNL